MREGFYCPLANINLDAANVPFTLAEPEKTPEGVGFAVPMLTLPSGQWRLAEQDFRAEAARREREVAKMAGQIEVIREEHTQVQDLAVSDDDGV